MRIIETQELTERLERGTPGEFWNVLTDEYFAGELIPGSRRVPLDRLGRELRAMALPQSTEIVVYCAGPTCPQSHAAAEKLGDLGYGNVLVYEGGIEAWLEVGHALMREPVTVG